MGVEAGLAAAFLAGLLGSTHCIAMCGGIAGWFGLNTASRGASGRAVFAVAYNGGRIAGYGALGAVAGFLGAGGGALMGVQHWGPALRVALGLVIVLIGLQLALDWTPLRRLEALGSGVWRRLAPLARRLLPATNPLHAAALGMLWGWLPCGLVYTVLLAASLAGGAGAGALIMLGFGLGTLPSMMLATGGAAELAKLTRHAQLRRAAGVLVVIAGLWTIAAPLGHPGDHGHAQEPAGHSALHH